MAMENLGDSLFQDFAPTACMFVIFAQSRIPQSLKFSKLGAFLGLERRFVIDPKDLMVVEPHRLDDIELDYLEIGGKIEIPGSYERGRDDPQHAIRARRFPARPYPHQPAGSRYLRQLFETRYDRKSHAREAARDQARTNHPGRLAAAEHQSLSPQPRGHEADRQKITRQVHHVSNVVRVA